MYLPENYFRDLFLMIGGLSFICGFGSSKVLRIINKKK